MNDHNQTITVGPEPQPTDGRPLAGSSGFGALVTAAILAGVILTVSYPIIAVAAAGLAGLGAVAWQRTHSKARPNATPKPIQS